MSSTKPETSLSSGSLFSKDESIAEAGRKIMAVRLEKPLLYERELEKTTSVVSVHETRKNLRRMRTALRLFAPYFASGLLNAYRKRFRKFMRLLGPSRDTAVFLEALDRFAVGGEREGPFSSQKRSDLKAMQQYWHQRQAAADNAVRQYLGKGTYHALLIDFQSFTQEVGHGVRNFDDPATPLDAGYIAPIMIYRKVALVRGFRGHLERASLDLLHSLRIRCKELRYTLEFFEPILDQSVTSVLDSVKLLAIHLGEVNDARVALEMMDKTQREEPSAVATLYQAAKEAELERLISGLPEKWADFDKQEWRQQLARSLALL